MAKLTYSYTAYPDSQKATELSKSRAGTNAPLSILALVLSLAMLFSYGDSVVALYRSLDLGYYFTTLAMLLVVSVFDLYVFVLHDMITKRKCTGILLREKIPEKAEPVIARLKQESHKNMKLFTALYYKWFFFLLLAGSALIGCVYSVYTLCHGDTGSSGLLISVTILGVCVLAALLKFLTRTSEGLELAEKEARRFQSFAKGTKVFCYAALAVFLFLLIKMAPGFGAGKAVSYVVIAAAAIGATFLFYKKEPDARQRSSHVFYAVCLTIAVILLAGSVGLRILYETKVDAATSDIPETGEVAISISLEKEFYSSIETGSVRNPKSNIRIGTDWYENGDTAIVPLNEKLPLRIGVGFGGEGGYEDTTILFTPSSLENGHALTKDISVTPLVKGRVTAIFSRTLDFWSVIFY